jgi:hypothetical protein
MPVDFYLILGKGLRIQKWAINNAIKAIKRGKT